MLIAVGLPPVNRKSDSITPAIDQLRGPGSNICQDSHFFACAGMAIIGISHHQLNRPEQKPQNNHGKEFSHHHRLIGNMLIAVGLSIENPIPSLRQ
jgi:hypothetical protein